MIKISFKRLLEIKSKTDDITSEEKSIINTFHVVYLIINYKTNKAYIGETDNTYIRLFLFWKEDKRHVDGINAPINKIFNGDYENTFFSILEKDCDNKSREYYWHDYYRNNFSFIIVSHPGRHGCDNPGNIGMIAIHKNNKQTYINKGDLDIYLKDNWEIGGKKQRPRTKSQKENISKAHKGQIPWNKGKKLTEQQKQSYKNIKRKINYRSYSESDRKILSEKNKNRVKINKDGIEKQIPKDKLNDYLSNGWSLGVIKRIALFKTPEGKEIQYNKMSAKRNHKDWIFIKDL